MHGVLEIEHCLIPISDGCQLAARIWLPEGAEKSPVPAILEYIPYRKRDVTAYYDSLTHPYFACHGYAAIRVDMRGSGDSGGVLLDEYDAQEHNDALEVLKWIASQRWCTGAIGMIGLSWGGITALQIAARQPTELKAVITVCSTDERYGNDIHYMGGALLNESLGWGTLFQAQISRPPDPTLVGEKWRQMWRERLENLDLPIETWLRHQRLDSYWKRASVSEHYERIRCPVFAVGGWADGYHNAILRLMRSLSGPRKALIGPWQHIYPHYTSPGPGPATGFLQEALRWWDHWLKGEDTGFMDEPMVRAWMQEYVRPSPNLVERPGRWIGETTWPSSRIKSKRYVLNLRTLDQQPTQETSLEISSPQSVGWSSGLWLPEHVGAELPGDQREDDARSVMFDSPPLTEPLEILGTPVVMLKLASDKPQVLIAVRLCAVAPDGTSDRVSYGILNLSHRDSDEAPKPVELNREYVVCIPLKDVAYAFPAGHRMRVALSSSYWPMVWPSPEAVTVTVFAGSSYLELPVRPTNSEDSTLRSLEPPTSSTPVARTVLREPDHDVTIQRNLRTGHIVITAMKDDGAFRLDAIGLEFDQKGAETYEIMDHDPLSARVSMGWVMSFRRGNWSVRTENCVLMTSTKYDFLLSA